MHEDRVCSWQDGVAGTVSSLTDVFMLLTHVREALQMLHTGKTGS